MKKIFLISLGLTLSFLLLVFVFPGPFQSLESKWIDQYFKFRGPIKTQNQVVLVTIDEKSLTKLGRWPWPRSTMAKLIDKLKNYQAQSIGFDITFSEKSSEDAALARALKNFENIYLGYFFYPRQQDLIEAFLSEEEILENDQAIYPSRLNLSSKQIATSGIQVYGVQTNVTEISQSLAADRQGFFNVFTDPDGVIRRIPLVLFYKGSGYPSLALQLATAAKGFSSVPLFDSGGNLEGLVIGEEKIPLSATGELFINYRGPSKTFPHISIADILEEKVSPEALQDKTILVGATAIGIYDIRVTPMDPVTPGVEVQANVIDNILAGDFLVTTWWTQFVSLLLILFIGLSFGLGLPQFRALNSFFVFLLFMSLLVFSGYLFFSKGTLLYMAKPVVNGFLVFGGVTIYRYFTEERERRKIKKTFQHYLSPIVIKQLLIHPEQLKLGGERKELTVLFSDIRDFTPKAEKLPPEKIVELLNEYFTIMTDCVFKHEGTLDKFMGDAIMAIFGAPIPRTDHALRASLTALEMINALKKYKEGWCKKYGIDDFKIGVGIHTGPMAVGNMGSEKRFNYTVIGDAVNLASRLESITKEYNTAIIISDTHYQLVKDVVEAKEMGTVRVKGKKETTLIYELLGKKAGAI